MGNVGRTEDKRQRTEDGRTEDKRRRTEVEGVLCPLSSVLCPRSFVFCHPSSVLKNTEKTFMITCVPAQHLVKSRHLLGVDVACATIEKQASGLAARQLRLAVVHLGRGASSPAESAGRPKGQTWQGRFHTTCNVARGVTASAESSSGDEDYVRRSRGR